MIRTITKPLTFIIIFIFSYIIKAQPILVQFPQEQKQSLLKKTEPVPLFDFRISTDQLNASSRYNSSSEEIILDTLDFTDTSDILHKYPYTTDRTIQKYNLHIGYLGLKDFYIYAKLPFVYANVYERFKYDSNLIERYDRNDSSKFFLEGLHIDAGYNIFSSYNFKLGILGNIFIPFEQYSSKTDTTDAPINNKAIELSRTFEATAGAVIDYKLDVLHFQLGGKYRYIANNDFSNRLNINFLLGLATIENTEIFANFKYVKSLGEYKSDYAVNFWRQTLWEEYAEVDIAFTMKFTQNLYVNAGYTLNIWGKNRIADKTLIINLGYIFNKK